MDFTGNGRRGDGQRTAIARLSERNRRAMPPVVGASLFGLPARQRNEILDTHTFIYK